jgi:hypothetical protein
MKNVNWQRQIKQTHILRHQKHHPDTTKVVSIIIYNGNQRQSKSNNHNLLKINYTLRKYDSSVCSSNYLNFAVGILIFQEMHFFGSSLKIIFR